MSPTTTRENSGGARDLAGYGSDPPRAAWPSQARIAVSVVINYEEGAELTPLDGDEQRDTRGEFDYGIPLDQRDVLQESTYEYGARAGIWRLFRVLDQWGVQATVFASARALERAPAVAEGIAVRGWDVAGHGYRWEPHVGMSTAEERAAIERAVASIESTTGQRVEGWFTRPPPSTHTRQLLAEAGLRWDSDSYADDLPYYEHLHTGPHLVVPYTLDVNDIRFWNGTVHTAEDWFQYARDTFDVLYDEGAERPRMMSVGLHPRIIGRPGRVRALSWFLAHIHSAPHVWVARRGDIARHWLHTHPPAERQSR